MAYRRSVEEMLDLALALRGRVAQGADHDEARAILREIGELGERVKRWREAFPELPGLEAVVDERLRHVTNIVRECTAILGQRPAGREPSTRTEASVACYAGAGGPP